MTVSGRTATIGPMQSRMDDVDFIPFLVEAAKHAAAVANYCDHAEHNEVSEEDWLVSAVDGLRELAIGLAAELRVDLFALYADRIAQIEAKSVHSRPGGFDGPGAVRTARTWHELQLAQLDHDRVYHPDVFGLTKADQLRHYALHLAKLSGALARAVDRDIARDELERRLPDILLFAIKVASVAGLKLSGERLPAAANAGTFTVAL
jgi:hypothetical protein